MKKQSGYQFCGGTDHASNPNRRDFLSVGALGGLGLGLTLGDLLSLEAQAAGEIGATSLAKASPARPRTSSIFICLAARRIKRLGIRSIFRRPNTAAHWAR